MFEKKRIKEEIIDIEEKLSEQDVWNDHNKSNNLLKRKFNSKIYGQLHKFE